MLSGPPVDRSSEMDDLTSLLRQLVADRREDQARRETDRELRRQDDERLKTQMFEQMDRRTAAVFEVASGVTGERVGTATSAGEVRGVSYSGSLPGLGAAIGVPRRGASSSVDSHSAEVGSREFRSLKQPVPQNSGKSEAFPLRKEHFEVFTSMVGLMSPFLVDHAMMIGDVTKNTQYFLSQGFSEEYIKTAID